MSFRPHYTLTPRIQELVIEIEAFKKYLTKMPLLQEWVERLQLEAQIEEIYHTTRIEGSLLTLPETRRVLIDDAHIPGKERSEQEVRNAAKARKFLLNLVNDRASNRITHDLLHKVQYLFMKDVDPDAFVGDYRRKKVNVIDKNTGRLIYPCPNWKDILSLMDKFLDWLNRSAKYIPIPIRAIVAHVIFVKIHPYEDGNGRTGRMLESLLLHKGGYIPHSLFSITNYYDDHQQDYYATLAPIRTINDDLTKWIEFALNGLLSEMDRIWVRLAIYHRNTLYLDLTHKNNANKRQLWLVKRLIEKEKVPISDYNKEFFKSSDRILRNDILKLERQGIVKRVKKGRETSIILNPDALIFDLLIPEENSGNE